MRTPAAARLPHSLSQHGQRCQPGQQHVHYRPCLRCRQHSHRRPRPQRQWQAKRQRKQRNTRRSNTADRHSVTSQAYQRQQRRRWHEGIVDSTSNLCSMARAANTLDAASYAGDASAADASATNSSAVHTHLSTSTHSQVSCRCRRSWRQELRAPTQRHCRRAWCYTALGG